MDSDFGLKSDETTSSFSADDTSFGSFDDSHSILASSIKKGGLMKKSTFVRKIKNKIKVPGIKKPK